MAYSDRKSKKLGCGCVIVAVLLTPLLLLNLVFPGPYTSTYPLPFDSERWKSVNDWTDESRCGMLADLQYRHGLEGKSRAEITDLLGPESHESLQDGIPTTSHWDLCPSFLDIWILEVRWENDRVAEVSVRGT